MPGRTYPVHFLSCSRQAMIYTKAILRPATILGARNLGDAKKQIWGGQLLTLLCMS